MSGLNLQKLEALLERVRRNRTAAPVRGNAPAPATRAAAAPAAPVPTTPATPKAPPVMASAPPARVEPPPYVAPSVRAEPPLPEPPRVEPARVEPPPYIEPPPRIEPPPVEAAASVAPPPEPPPPITTPSWQPEPGSAVQARPTSVPPMEISDDDLLDVTTLPPVAAPAGEEAPQIEVSASQGEAASEAEDVAGTEAEEELPPASSRRFKVPESLDDGLAGAAQRESEREIPVKTPPPESGPQEALPATGLEAARMPDVAELEADLGGPPSMGPTAEQLGETIELDAPRGPELEIDVTVVAEEDSVVPAPAEELEVSLPRPSLQSGLYDVAAAPVPAPAISVDVPPARASEAVTTPAASTADAGPEKTARPVLGATDVAQVSFAEPASPRTFLELLDASLGL